MRSALTVLVAAAALGLAPAAAWAHGGDGAAYAGQAGPYEVYAYDPVAGGQAGVLEYRLILLDAANDTPVDGATATIQATSAGGRTAGPLTARSVANVYYYDLPDPGDRIWTVRLSIDGSLGTASTSYSMHGAEDTTPAAAAQPADDHADTGVLVGSGTGVAIAIGIAGSIALRRRSQSPAARDGKSST